jgi:hypothetical protein
MMTVREIPGEPLVVRLPVWLTAAARRRVALACGTDARPGLDFDIDQLTELDEDERRRTLECLDTTEVILEDDVDEDEHGRPFMTKSAQAARYGDMSYNAGHWYVEVDGDQVRIDEACYPGDGGRTCTGVDIAAEQFGREFVGAALRGRPAVDEIDQHGHVSLDAVLGAYAKAGELASLLARLVADGYRPQAADGAWDFIGEHSAVRMDATAVILCGSSGAVALHRLTDAGAFDRAAKAVGEAIDAGKSEAAAALADRVCAAVASLRTNGGEPPDDSTVAVAVTTHAHQIAAEYKAKRSEAEAQVAYDTARDEWIAQHGSTRLQRAAVRGYRIDGLYRDERMQIDLPGMIGFLGKGAKVRDVSNPTSEALDQEEECIEAAAAQGLGDEHVRIVYVVGSEDHPDGEYVQINGYLGKHTAYQRVTSEIPF